MTRAPWPLLFAFSQSISEHYMASVVMLATSSSAEDKPAAAPDFAFILVDDQRNDTLGCAGHPHIHTPHLDRLAAQGVHFSNSFVTTPICMSSRGTILTGMPETGLITTKCATADQRSSDLKPRAWHG